MYTALKEKIASFIHLTESELDTVVSFFSACEIDKGGIVFREGSVCNQYYFLEKGLLRFIYTTIEKDETSWVIAEGVFFTEIISLKTRQKTTMRLEAVEPSTVLAITEESLARLCEAIPLFEKFLRLTWEENLFHVIEMKLLQQFSTARQRYEVLSRDKKLVGRIPQKYLASILGITPYSLSRLRNPKNFNA